VVTKKNDSGFLGVPVNGRTALTAAQVGSNFVPGGQVMNAGLDMAGASLDVDDYIKETSALMGEDARHLQAGSPAFKNYIKKELPEIYGDRMVGLGFSLAGGAAAMALVGMTFGLPGGFLGMLVGGAIGIGGTIVAGMVKEALFPSSYNSFLNFASQLQNMGQQKQMSPESAFVALVVNMPDERSKKDVISSLPKYLRVTDGKGLIKLLNTDEGREALRAAMVEHDATVRASVGAMSVLPSRTISEQFAQLVNNGQIAGVDLLNGDKTGHVGSLIAMVEMQQSQQMQVPQMQPQIAAQQNPNMHLPMGNALQRGV